MKTRFTTRRYGDYKCCQCHKPLVGIVNTVGDVEDEEGYEWRTFCNRCWNDVQEKTDAEIFNIFETNRLI